MLSISRSEHLKILHHIDSGKNARQIASITRYHHSTISKIWSIHRPHVPKSRGGRPPTLTPQDLRHAIRLIISGKVDNCVQVAHSLHTITGKSFSPETIRLHLKAQGLKAVVKKKRPLLTKVHRRARLDWAIEHQHWTLEDWKRVVWSDETKINRLGSDGRQWIWKKIGEGLSDREVEETLKFGGGSLMMWGCMSWEGAGMACKIDGKMDAKLYCSILEDELLGSLEEWNFEVDDIIFQQDNDPKHTSNMAKKWLRDHFLVVLSWPAQSPDLNPIEHLWFHLKRRLAGYENPPQGILELWERVQVEWEKIGVATCRELIESMTRRVAAVLKAKGGYRKY